jgi:hypothetical protein
MEQSTEPVIPPSARRVAVMARSTPGDIDLADAPTTVGSRPASARHWCTA